MSLAARCGVGRGGGRGACSAAIRPAEAAAVPRGPGRPTSPPPSWLRSRRASELDKALNAWEENRLITSGVVRAREVVVDYSAEDEARMVLLVHDTKPPFLEGQVVNNKQVGQAETGKVGRGSR